MNRRFFPLIACSVLLLGIACQRDADKSKLLATVGSEKITEKRLETHIRTLAPTPEEATAFLSDARKAEREQFLNHLIQLKSMTAFGLQQGLDKDPKAKLLVEQAVAQTYMQLLLERRMDALKPTQAQLKELYDELTAQAGSKGKMGEAIPPFEKVEAQLTPLWKQRQAPEVQASLIKEVEQKVKVVRAEEKPAAPQPAPEPGAAPDKKN